MRKILSSFLVALIAVAAISICPAQVQAYDDEGYIKKIKYKKFQFFLNGVKIKANPYYTEIEADDGPDDIKFCHLRNGDRVEVEGSYGRRKVNAKKIEVKNFFWRGCKVPCKKDGEIFPKGKIDSIDREARTIVVYNKTFKEFFQITDCTKFRKAARNFSDLRVGQKVKVKARHKTDGVIVAVRVKAWPIK